MTYLVGHAATVDIVIGAARGQDRSTFDGLDSRTRHHAGNAVPVDPCHATLLSRILTATSGAGPHCVQFVACGAAGRATGAALAAARAAACLLGKTLLINARLDLEMGPENGDMGAVPVPDAFVPQLYHHRLAQSPVDLAILYGGTRRSAFNTFVAPFRFVAIDTPAPEVAPSVSALAPLCIGCVLVVSAGATTRHSVREAAQYIRYAGGKLIGTVLDHAAGVNSGWVSR